VGGKLLDALTDHADIHTASPDLQTAPSDLEPYEYLQKKNSDQNDSKHLTPISERLRPSKT
jgi:hypothetical protein